MNKTLKDMLEVKNAVGQTADLYIYGDIVTNQWSSWDDEATWPAEIRDFLKDVEGKDLNVYINSGGGSVFAGMAIHSMLKRHQGKKTAYIDGVAASIASIIALACDEINIPANAYFMIHKPLVSTFGNADDLRASADFLDTIEKGCVSIYDECSIETFDEEAIKDALTAETWYTGTEAAEIFTKMKVTHTLQAVACLSETFNSSAKVPKNLNKKTVQNQMNEFLFDF